jgi:hypothetical protein
VAPTPTVEVRQGDGCAELIGSGRPTVAPTRNVEDRQGDGCAGLTGSGRSPWHRPGLSRFGRGDSLRPSVRAKEVTTIEVVEDTLSFA